MLKESQLKEGSEPNARLHHIGFVVRSIESEIAAFASSILASEDVKIFYDPVQRVKVTFLQTSNPADAPIELIEPCTDDSPVQKFLKKGGGLHHLCYEVGDLDGHLHKMQGLGAVVVRHPQPAIAFENRRIAWVMTKQRLLLEFLEKQKPG